VISPLRGAWPYRRPPLGRHLVSSGGPFLARALHWPPQILTRDDGRLNTVRWGGVSKPRPQREPARPTLAAISPADASRAGLAACPRRELSGLCSRTRDEGPGIGSESVTRGRGTTTCPTDFPSAGRCTYQPFSGGTSMHKIRTRGAPGPIAGAGLPVLAPAGEGGAVNLAN
jgi:hypothetical protein